MGRLTDKENAKYLNSLNCRKDRDTWIYLKLAKFEDLMEKYGLNIISDIEDVFLKFKHIQHANQALKERWEKLKCVVQDDIAENKRLFSYAEKKEDRNFLADYVIAGEFVLDKIEELEIGESGEVNGTINKQK